MAPASAVASGSRWWGRSVLRRLAGPAAFAALTLVALLILVPAGSALAAEPPTITAIAPSSGPTTGGTSVVITGTGFAGLSGTSAVSFGGTDAASYTVLSETQITAVTPAHASGTLHVTVTAAGVPSSNTSADSFMFMTRYDQTDSRLGRSGTWATFSTSKAWKGSYGRASANGASVTITFNGTRLDWIAMKGTTTGIADVYLDDVFAQTIYLANPTAVYQQKVWSTGDLSNGIHRVRIVRSSASASGKYLTIDAVDVIGTIVGTGRIEQTDTRLAYTGTWATFATSGASGGSYRQASTSGASVTMEFNGTYLAWIATRGTTLGAAWVSLDGADATRIDLAATATAHQQKVWNAGELALGRSPVKIEVTDGKNPAPARTSASTRSTCGGPDPGVRGEPLRADNPRLALLRHLVHLLRGFRIGRRLQGGYQRRLPGQRDLHRCASGLDSHYGPGDGDRGRVRRQGSRQRRPLRDGDGVSAEGLVHRDR